MSLPRSIPQGLERGRVRDILHLGPEDFQIDMIAERLSKINRYCGALQWPLSVATHSVLVSRLCPAEFAKAGLLHDITETFGIGDVISPVKRVVRGVKEIEDAIRVQLLGAFPDLHQEGHPSVRHADERAYQLECLYIRGREPEPGHTSFPFENPSVDEKEICATLLRSEVPWRVSRHMFLTRYKELFL